MVVEVIEQRLSRHPRAPEHERAAHEFGVGMDGTMIESQHNGKCMASELAVNDGVRVARRLTTQAQRLLRAGARGALAARRALRGAASVTRAPRPELQRHC